MKGQMSSLLDQVLEAHGGVARWRSFSVVRATIVTGGALWGMKGLTQDSAPRQMTVWLHEEKASVTPFGAPDQRTAFTPDRIAIEKSDGTVVAERRQPRESFRGHELLTGWDPLHRAYFNGYALWNYLTMPFLMTLPGVDVQEIAPWREENEVWRRLRVRFPESIATHSAVQEFYFDQYFLLRRHDYRVDVSGGIAAAQYVHDYVEADGLRMPTKRCAYLLGSDGQAARGMLLVSIDLSDIQYS